MEKKQLTYGLFNDKLKHISKVENGLACNCVCANCKHPLVAKNKQGNIKVAHFAHHADTECAGAVETALHLLAKEVFEKTKEMMIPPFHHDYNPENRDSLFRECTPVKFDCVLIETPIDIAGKIITPDAIGMINKKAVYIEFAKTHFIDEHKKEKLKAGNLACIEIDLKDQPLDKAALNDFFNSDTKSKYWIQNPRLDRKYFKYKARKDQEQKKKEEAERLKKQLKIKEARDKLQKYRNDQSVRVLKTYRGEITNCPKKQAALNQLKHEPIYKHPVLKRIIDGEYWNQRFYGRMPSGRWIYIGKEKVEVYPSGAIWGRLNKREVQKCRLLFSGLNRLEKKLKNPEFGDCKYCEFSVDHFSIEGAGYEICGYPT